MKKGSKGTLRQQKAIQNVMENKGIVSKAMRDAGYSPKTAKNPKVLTESKTWERLMEKHLPDKLLVKKHKELLKIPRTIRHFKKGELETEIEELDSNAIKAGLDMAYKLKGKYAGDKEKPFIPNPTLNIFLTKNEKVIKVIQESQKELRKALEGEIKEND